METVNQWRWNGALWTGFILMLLALLSNVLLFFKVPGQQALPWLGLLLSVAGLVLVVAGMMRAFGRPDVYRGKISGVILTVVSMLLFGLGAFGFYTARHIPAVAGAPQVGQKAPEFSMADSSGKPVSLAQLLSTPMANAAHPKGVLLVFYRGYW